MITKSNNHLKSNGISKCKSFFLFYTKNLLFLFYIINLQKHPHQIIYNTQSFIKTILFHIFYYYFPYTYMAPPPYQTVGKHHFSEHSLILFLLLSSSMIFLLQHVLSFFFFFFFCYSFFLSYSSFSFQNKKKKKKNSFSFSPLLSLSNWCSLQIYKKKKKKNLSTKLPWLNTLTHSLMAAASLGFGGQLRLLLLGIEEWVRGSLTRQGRGERKK